MKLGRRLTAAALAVLLFSGLSMIGCVGSFWLGVLIVTAHRFGWSAMHFAIEPYQYPIIPVPVIPSGGLGHPFVVILGIAGGGVGCLAGILIWRYLMVRRLGWMTLEQTNEVLKRDPGW